MKVVGVLLLTVAATLVVTAHGHDSSMMNMEMMKTMQTLFQLCHDTAKSAFSEGMQEMCKKENIQDITTNCFPEMNDNKAQCLTDCLNDPMGPTTATGFVEALMTKERKICIIEIMKRCVQEKTNMTLPKTE